MEFLQILHAAPREIVVKVVNLCQINLDEKLSRKKP